MLISSGRRGLGRQRK